jgi:hypothetical protein
MPAREGYEICVATCTEQRILNLLNFSKENTDVESDDVVFRGSGCLRHPLVAKAPALRAVPMTVEILNAGVRKDVGRLT